MSALRKLALSDRDKSSSDEFIKKVYRSLEQYKQALRKYKKDTKGVDIWTPTDLRNLPDSALQGIVDAMDLSHTELAWAHQCLVSLNALLGKPNGGVRTVTKTPVTYRMDMRADKSVQDWENRNNSPYDKATKGSSALSAALIRNVRAEVAHYNDDVSAAVFNDYDFCLILSILKH